MKPINLDTIRQPELYAEACRYMAECIPDWNDRYPGDPAVAILEYLSYLSEVQLRHFNRILPAHQRAYLALLGQTARTSRPARLLAMRNDEEITFPGKRYEMDGVPFEVTGCPGERMPQVMKVEFLRDGQCDALWHHAALQIPGGKNGSLRLTLSGELPLHRSVRFWVQIIPEPGRNPPAADTKAPVTMTAQVGGADAECTDFTCGLLQSGMISVTAEAPGSEVLLRMHGPWEGRPQLRNVVLEPLELSQQLTRSTMEELVPPFRLPAGWLGNRVLRFFTPEKSGWQERPEFYAEAGLVTGWPGDAPERIRVVSLDPDFMGSFPLRGIAMERIALEEPGICPDSLQVMVEQNGLWLDCPLQEPEPGVTLPLGCRWEPEQKRLYFGDGGDYLIPEPGTVLICGCRTTRGAELNGACTALTGDGLPLQPLTAAEGGVTEETPAQAFERAALEQQELRREVTCEDYAAFAAKTPGLHLSRVRAVPRTALGEQGAGVVIFAKPGSDGTLPLLTLWQKERILEALEPVRMIGVPVEIRPARMCAIRVRVSVASTEPIPKEVLRQAAIPFTDSVEGPLDFGAELSYTALYAALSSAPHVRQLRRLDLISLSGGVRRGSDGSLCLAPDQLPYLEDFEVIE